MADLDDEVDGELNSYMRRYLNDKIDISDEGPEIDLDLEDDSELNPYIRRYLNDRIE